MNFTCLCLLDLAIFSNIIGNSSNKSILYKIERHIEKTKIKSALEQLHNRILNKNYSGYVIRTTNGKFFSLSSKKNTCFVRKRSYVPVFFNELDAREYLEDLTQHKKLFCCGIEVCQVNFASLYLYKQNSSTKFLLIENLKNIFYGPKYYKDQIWVYTVSIKLYKSHLIKIFLFKTNQDALQFLDFYKRTLKNKNSVIGVNPSELLLPLHDKRITTHKMFRARIYAFPLKSCIIHWTVNRTQIENEISLGETIVIFADDVVPFSPIASENIVDPTKEVITYTTGLSDDTTGLSDDTTEFSSQTIFRTLLQVYSDYYFGGANGLYALAKASFHLLSNVFQAYCDRVHSRLNLIKVTGILFITRRKN